MPTYGRLTCRLTTESRPFDLLLMQVLSKEALVQYALTLQQWTAATIIQAEFCEIVDVDGVAADADAAYGDRQHQMLVTMRNDANYHDVVQVCIPAPADAILEPGRKNIYVQDEIGALVAQAYSQLSGQTYNYERGALSG